MIVVTIALILLVFIAFSYERRYKEVLQLGKTAWYPPLEYAKIKRVTLVKYAIYLIAGLVLPYFVPIQLEGYSPFYLLLSMTGIVLSYILAKFRGVRVYREGVKYAGTSIPWTEVAGATSEGNRLMVFASGRIDIIELESDASIIAAAINEQIKAMIANNKKG